MSFHAANVGIMDRGGVSEMAMTEQERALCIRAERAVHAIREFGLDPYSALWLTIQPTEKMLEAEKEKKAA